MTSSRIQKEQMQKSVHKMSHMSFCPPLYGPIRAITRSYTLVAHKLVWYGVSIWHTLAACVHPDSTQVACNHPLSIINMSAAVATNHPVLKTPCIFSIGA